MMLGYFRHGGSMTIRLCILMTVSVIGLSRPTEGAPFDPAAAFGARQGVSGLSLSPDGKSVAYVAPMAGQGAALFTLDLAEGSKPNVAVVASGKPERLGSCHWVSNDRLVCVIYGVVKGAMGLMPFTRLVAADRSGGNLKLLSKRDNEYTRGWQLGGGDIIDWLPEESGAVLMTRVYLPDDHLGSHVGSDAEGLGVDRVDTHTLAVKLVEKPVIDAVEYLSDGRGRVRIMGRESRNETRDNTGVYTYFFRAQGSQDWQKLSEYNSVARTGFQPLAVDADTNSALGYQKLDGRMALYSVSLDGSKSEKLVFARPDVDVGGLITMGRRARTIGVTYSTDATHAVYFDADIERLMRSLSKALPKQPQVDIVDASVDEQTLLIFAGSDDDAGVYYIYDRPSKHLRTFLVVRSELEGVALAKVTPMTYPAADGVSVPAYLTLPPGVVNPKGLPAIVLPHGGPSARDEWGFDWLPQFYAARGYAVIQPNFRGSSGYGDAWLNENGFRSWAVAIGDVLDAGRWLVAQGIADPNKLAVVGWSYGGYAALQSAVVDPTLFRAVVAIAPVTDLPSLKEEWHEWSNYNMVRNEIGEGPYVRDGSPARHADKIKAPVLLFHGGFDRNVSIHQSRIMAASLSAAGVKNQLVTWDDLDHQLEDASARTDMLRKSDAWLQAAMGGSP
jgi:dipeptidyl aminopeptidase/acylaminoacyl peptidase